MRTGAMAYLAVLVAAAAAAYFHVAAPLDRKVRDAQMRFLRENFPRPVSHDVVLPSRSYRFLAPVDQPGTNYDTILLRALLQTKREVPVLFAKTWDFEA